MFSSLTQNPVRLLVGVVAGQPHPGAEVSAGRVAGDQRRAHSAGRSRCTGQLAARAPGPISDRLRTYLPRQALRSDTARMPVVVRV